MTDINVKASSIVSYEPVLVRPVPIGYRDAGVGVPVYGTNPHPRRLDFVVTSAMGSTVLITDLLPIVAMSPGVDRIVLDAKRLNHKPPATATDAVLADDCPRGSIQCTIAGLHPRAAVGYYISIKDELKMVVAVEPDTGDQETVITFKPVQTKPAATGDAVRIKTPRGGFLLIDPETGLPVDASTPDGSFLGRASWRFVQAGY